MRQRESRDLAAAALRAKEATAGSNRPIDVHLSLRERARPQREAITSPKAGTSREFYTITTLSIKIGQPLPLRAEAVPLR